MNQKFLVLPELPWESSFNENLFRYRIVRIGKYDADFSLAQIEEDMIIGLCAMQQYKDSNAMQVVMAVYKDLIPANRVVHSERET